MSLNLATLKHLLWLANRRSRAKAKAARGRGYFGNETEGLEKSIMNEMRPHLPAILRAAIRDTLARKMK